MGVDIYGRNPKIKSEKPELNFETASEAEKDGYFKILDDWEEENPGYYFRANWWSWRPIHLLADVAIYTTELPLDTKGWDENGGHGLKTQEECDMLADAIDIILLLNKKHMSEDDDRVYICLGSWVTQDGRFIGDKKAKKLNEVHPIGTILYNGIVSEDGELVFPSHGASLSHVKEFITFLRSCGGFQIF